MSHPFRPLFVELPLSVYLRKCDENPWLVATGVANVADMDWLYVRMYTWTYTWTIQVPLLPYDVA